MFHKCAKIKACHIVDRRYVRSDADVRHIFIERNAVTGSFLVRVANNFLCANFGFTEYWSMETASSSWYKVKVFKLKYKKDLRIRRSAGIGTLG